MMLWSVGAFAERKSLRTQLDGSWKLVSTEQVLTDGSRGPSPLYGPGRVQYLVFADDSESSMCVIVDQSPRAEDALHAYCGRYELNEAERSLVYDVVFDAVPND